MLLGKMNSVGKNSQLAWSFGELGDLGSFSCLNVYGALLQFTYFPTSGAGWSRRQATDCDNHMIGLLDDDRGYRCVVLADGVSLICVV